MSEAIVEESHSGRDAIFVKMSEKTALRAVQGGRIGARLKLAASTELALPKLWTVWPVRRFW
jgi:hypothetical protein